ncbi:MAG: hypothetical protein JSV49_12480 [Thermoplasmata archaeon]|nr:MAG: hypothetical protein JSV49_12480 [Thermoplasmata archaeon]
MKLLIRICAVLILLILINIPFLPTYLAEANSNQPDPEEEHQHALQKTFFYMRQGKVLIPESPEPDDAPKTVSLPPKKEPIHPKAPGRFFFQWVWQTLPIQFETTTANAPVDLGHNVNFKVWFTSTEENLGTIRFRFTLLHNNDPIAQTDVASYSEDLPKDRDGSVTAGAGINITGSRLDVGDTLEMKIDYLVDGYGLKLKFDNPLYDSGFELEANPLKIRSIHASQDRVTVGYQEAFNVKVNKLTFVTKIDEAPITEAPIFSSSRDGPIVYWDVNLKAGTHTILVMLSYGSNDNESMVMRTEEVNIVVVKPWEFLGLEASGWGWLIILIILFAIIIYAYRRWRANRDALLMQEFE